MLLLSSPASFQIPPLLPLLLFTLSISALASPAPAPSPVLVSRSPITLSLSRQLNLTSLHNLVRHDQARARALRLGARSRASSSAGAGEGGGEGREDEKREAELLGIGSEPVTNQAVEYVASVDIGSPATTYQLLVDTGSSNTWVGASTPYVATGTSKSTGDSVSVSYGSGSFSGTEYTDRLSLGPGLTIPHQSIGVASTSLGINPLDGILGIGPTDLTQHTLPTDPSETIPTVTDNLFHQGSIFAYEVGVSFEPTSTNPNENGEITWGGTNPLKYFLPITYIPITSTYPASLYWGIDQSIRYGPSTTILSTTAGIVDTGTTLIGLATDAYNKYRDATGSTLDENVGLLSIPSSKYSGLKSLYFTTGGTTFELIPNAQIWPRALNSDIGGTAGSIYLVMSDLQSPSGQGLDFINGLTFLERFYSVYDSGNRRVGLANTAFTRAEVN